MIFVITHKKFDDTIIDKEHYTILHVGKNNNCDEHYLRDDNGDNISGKNPSYCELTGLYWVWKNYEDDPDSITGLVHYRRFFTTRLQDLLYTYLNISPRMLNYGTVQKVLQKADIIVPQRVKIFRTVREFYSDLHVGEDLGLTRKAIEKVRHESLSAYDDVMNSHYFYFANMMICKRKYMEDYCNWLFPILSELETRIDLEKHEDAYQKRVFGFISERLLQVWIAERQLKVKEYPVYNTEEKRITVFKKNKNRLDKILGKLSGDKERH